MLNQCEREIVELHVFFEQWLRAEVPESYESMKRFMDVTPPGFHLVTTSGEVQAYEEICATIFDGYGTRPTMKMWVDNVQLLHTLPDGLYLVSYHELQQYGDGETTVRISTVLLHDKAETPNGLEWLHVHETWINPPTE